MKTITAVEKYLISNIPAYIEVLEGSHKGKYLTEIMSVKENIIYMKSPLSRVESTEFKQNIQVKVFYNFNKYKCMFQSMITNDKRINDKLLCLIKPNKIFIGNTRKYDRIKTNKKIIILKNKIEFKNGKIIKNKTPKTVLNLNICPGGIKILATEKLEEGQSLELDLKKSYELDNIVFGKVVYQLKNFETGIEFISIDENDKNKIINFTEKKQNDKNN